MWTFPGRDCLRARAGQSAPPPPPAADPARPWFGAARGAAWVQTKSSTRARGVVSPGKPSSARSSAAASGPVALRRQAGQGAAGRRNRPVHNAQGGAPVGVEPLRRGPQLLGRPPLGQQYAVLQGGHGAVWHPHQGSGQVVEALPLRGLAVDVQAVPHQGGLDAAHPAVEAATPSSGLGLQIRPLQLEIGSLSSSSARVKIRSSSAAPGQAGPGGRDSSRRWPRPDR